MRDNEARMRRMEMELFELRQLVRELTGPGKANATNSSIPPSANPPGAPKPRTKKPTGRPAGGQVGHAGHFRKLLPLEEVDRVVVQAPEHCPGCGEALEEEGRELLSRHQVMELPAVLVDVTEHQAYACRCRHCGRRSAGAIPQSIFGHSFGPRLSAVIAMLASHFRGSRRSVEYVIREVMGCPISLGSVMAKEEEMSQALHQPYEQVKERVRRARVKYVDETGWRRAQHWLFAAATRAACLFGLSHSRTWPGLERMLGEEVTGTICTDRFGIYERHPLERRGLCWAHLKRDFQRCVDRGGAGGEVGERGLKLCRRVFGLWRKLKEGRFGRGQLQERLKRVKGGMRKLLLEGARCGVKKTMGFCRNVWRLWPALWAFATVRGLEPTNNLVERMLRPAVLWRKQSLGSHSKAGCRFVERMLSVSTTLKMHGKSVLDYLEAALRAHRLDQPPPALSC